MVEVHEAEARYQTVLLIKKHPHLSHLLFKLQNEGADWIKVLEMLQQASEASEDGDRYPPP